MDLEAWEQWEAGRRREAGPFGGLDALWRRKLGESSVALLEGAENLLAKAVKWWQDDRPRALGYIERASRLPFDDHERVLPAASAAGFLLYTMVVDEFEDCPEGDTLWLDAALQVLEVDTTARFYLRDVLVTADQDYDVSADEHRLLRAAVEPIPPRPVLRALTDLGPDRLRDEVIAIVDVCVAYQEALEQIALETTP